MPTQAPVFPKFVFQPTAKRGGEVLFIFTVNNLSWLTVVSSPIPFGFKIACIRMCFDDDHVNNVQHYWLCDHNATVSATGISGGVSVFGQVVPTPFIVGSNREMRLYPNFVYEGKLNYIKLCIHNLNNYVVQINCSVYIEEI